MKKFQYSHEDNEGASVSGLAQDGKYICYKSYIVSYFQNAILQQLLYEDTRLKQDLAEAAAAEWDQFTHGSIRRTILRIFGDAYRQEVYGVNSDSETQPSRGLVSYNEARKHMVEVAQTLVEWCMYEYSHYPYEWGVAPPPVDLTQYIPDNLWAEDITKGARKIGKKIEAGEEIDFERVREGEYNYDEQQPAVSAPHIDPLQPITTGKKRVDVSPRMQRRMEEERLQREREQQAKLQEEAELRELAEIDALLDQREALIEEYATDLTLDQTDDKPSDDIYIELPLTAAEIVAATLRRKESEATSGRREPEQFTPRKTVTPRRSATAAQETQA